MEILAYWARAGNNERERVGRVQNTSGKQGLKISDGPENAGNRTLYAVVVVEDFTYAYRTDQVMKREMLRRRRVSKLKKLKKRMVWLRQRLVDLNGTINTPDERISGQETNGSG